ncbi:MAG: glucuronate isomerase [Lachnospiraceae bacterium]|nr:glucuronate isomerase [Lachnospiraceae bacterium]
MTRFLEEDFLLTTPAAHKLYYEYAAKMPIYDYHCHIDPKEIWEDRKFENITQIWLGGDHYKWRILRSNGVDEKYITGNASDREKFQKFAETLPRCIGNPMYHWCHMELKNYFGYQGILNGNTAEEVWNLTEERLQQSDFSARSLIRRSNVAMVGTTDDPCSDLIYHKLLKDSDFKVKVLPSFRPDPALNIHKPGFKEYIGRLSSASGMEISSAADVARALSRRMEYFDTCGCRSADHGLDYVMFRPESDKMADLTYQKALNGDTLSVEEIESYQTYLLLHCGREYARLGWVMQLHFSCMRNPNSRAFGLLGPDSGFDSIAVSDSCANLYSLMDAWERENKLPKTILYSLNPADNQWIDTLLGAFQGSGISGKIQHGSAWWFNDHITGMTDQLISLGNLGILGNFVGMLTDSRSFLSYARHEYFRRILCNLLGRYVEQGEYPDDWITLGTIVQDICGNNTKRYFNLEGGR